MQQNVAKEIERRNSIRGPNASMVSLIKQESEIVVTPEPDPPAATEQKKEGPPSEGAKT